MKKILICLCMLMSCSCYADTKCPDWYNPNTNIEKYAVRQAYYKCSIENIRTMISKPDPMFGWMGLNKELSDLYVAMDLDKDTDQGKLEIMGYLINYEFQFLFLSHQYINPTLPPELISDPSEWESYIDTNSFSGWEDLLMKDIRDFYVHIPKMETYIMSYYIHNYKTALNVISQDPKFRTASIIDNVLFRALLFNKYSNNKIQRMYVKKYTMPLLKYLTDKNIISAEEYKKCFEERTISSNIENNIAPPYLSK